jgi:hypothetical protein
MRTLALGVLVAPAVNIRLEEQRNRLRKVLANRKKDGGETYSRIEPLRSYGTLQSYWTTTKLRKLTVVLDYY